MDFTFSREDEAFRLEVRQFARDNVPPKLRREAVYGFYHLSREAMLGWTRILHRKGWSAPHWPRQYGGAGWTPSGDARKQFARSRYPLLHKLYVLRDLTEPAPKPATDRDEACLAFLEALVPALDQALFANDG